MSENFLGEIRMFGGAYAPMNWALCDGQILGISQNSALFSLLGTNYGGNGQTTFGLPDLRGRLAVGSGTGPGLTTRVIGTVGGSEAVMLTSAQLPPHPHMLQASTVAGSATAPGNTVLPAPPFAAGAHFFTTPTPTAPTITSLSAASCGNAGSSQPHSNFMPSLCVSFIIALQGLFPSRN